MNWSKRNKNIALRQTTLWKLLLSLFEILAVIDKRANI